MTRNNCCCIVLVLSLIVTHIKSNPCGNINEPPNTNDNYKIHFMDNLRTITINGTVVTCYQDGTPVKDPNDTSSSSESTEFDQTSLGSRIDNDVRKKISTPPISSAQSTGPYKPIRNRCGLQNQTYCTNSENYPLEHIDALIRKSLHKYNDVFGSDVILNDVSTRIDVDEEQLCDSLEEVIYPTEGQRQDDTFLFIINTQVHRQGVRISKCLNPSKPCHMAESFPNNYRTECKQQYVYRELLALEPNGAVSKDKFRFPACCSCVFRRV